MKEPDEALQEAALAAREIRSIVDGVIARADPTETVVLKRIGDLAHDIEARTRQSVRADDRQDLGFVDLATIISMISGILYMLSLLNK